MVSAGKLHDIINDKNIMYKKIYNGETLYNILLD